MPPSRAAPVAPLAAHADAPLLIPPTSPLLSSLSPLVITPDAHAVTMPPNLAASCLAPPREAEAPLVITPNHADAAPPSRAASCAAPPLVITPSSRAASSRAPLRYAYMAEGYPLMAPSVGGGRLLSTK